MPWERPTTGLQPNGGYIPPAGFPNITAALNRARTGQGTATFGALGASITGLGAGGTACSDLLTKPYGVLQRSALIAAGYPINGDTMLPTASAAYNNAVAYSSGPPFVMDVAPLAWQLLNAWLGPWPAPVWTTITTMPLMHFTHPSAALGYNARAFVLYCLHPTGTAGRTAHIQDLSGGNDTLITSLGDGLVHGALIQGLADTPNQGIRFGNQGAASIAVVPLCVGSFRSPAPTGASGVHWLWSGVPGSFTFADLACTAGSGMVGKIEGYIGPATAAPLYTANANLNPPFNCDLYYVDLGDDIVTVGANWQTLNANPALEVSGAAPDVTMLALDRIAALGQFKPADVVVHWPNLPNSLLSDTNPSAVTYALSNKRAFQQMVFSIAQQAQWGIINTDARWGDKGGTLANALGTFLQAAGTNPHPTDAGHFDIYHNGIQPLGLP